MMASAEDKYTVARARMVREQLAARSINDERVLTVMGEIPRHLFVEDALQLQAYSDFPLPIGEGQTISQPYIVALMSQGLALTGAETVLEIGTGCGYQTAVLSRLADRVFSVERIKALHIKARRNLDQLQRVNVLCKVDDGTVGWQDHAPYDAIMVTAASPDLPEPLLAQLADPGRLVIPIGDRISQDLVCFHKKDGKISRQVLEQVRFVSLIGRYGWQE